MKVKGLKSAAILWLALLDWHADSCRYGILRAAPEDSTTVKQGTSSGSAPVWWQLGM